MDSICNPRSECFVGDSRDSRQKEGKRHLRPGKEGEEEQKQADGKALPEEFPRYTAEPLSCLSPESKPALYGQSQQKQAAHLSNAGIVLRTETLLEDNRAVE